MLKINSQYNYIMKKYCLLFMSGLTCLMEEEREMILHDEQMLRQGMDEDDRRNRDAQLQRKHKWLLAARGQVSKLQRIIDHLKEILIKYPDDLSSKILKQMSKERILGDLLENLLIENEGKNFLDNVLMRNTHNNFLENLLSEAINRNLTKFFYVQQQEPQYINVDELLKHKARDRFGNYDDHLLQRIIAKTDKIYLPVIQQKRLPSNNLPADILSPLLDEAWRKYQLVRNTLEELMGNPNRQTKFAIDPDTEDNIPVFIQFVW